MNFTLFSTTFLSETCRFLFNNIKTNTDLVHMDDAQRWSYLEKAWEMRKKALYPDIIYLQNLFLLYLKVTI